MRIAHCATTSHIVNVAIMLPLNRSFYHAIRPVFAFFFAHIPSCDGCKHLQSQCGLSIVLFLHAVSTSMWHRMAVYWRFMRHTYAIMQFLKVLVVAATTLSRLRVADKVRVVCSILNDMDKDILAWLKVTMKRNDHLFFMYSRLQIVSMACSIVWECFTKRCGKCMRKLWRIIDNIGVCKVCMRVSKTVIGSDNEVIVDGIDVTIDLMCVVNFTREIVDSGERCLGL